MELSASFSNAYTSSLLTPARLSIIQKAANNAERGVSEQANQQRGVQKNSDQKPGELTDEQKQVVERLKARDREVRQHEQAHLAAARGYASGPTYSYTVGPDGKRYAIAGEVTIDTSPGSTPEETIQKAQIIINAANAPAQPSAQDGAVASQAAQQLINAQRELQEKKSAEAEQRRAKNTENPQPGKSLLTGLQEEQTQASSQDGNLVAFIAGLYENTTSIVQNSGATRRGRFPSLVI